LKISKKALDRLGILVTAILGVWLLMFLVFRVFG